MKKEIKVSSISPIRNNAYYHEQFKGKQNVHFNNSLDKENEKEKNKEQQNFVLDHNTKIKLMKALTFVKDGLTIEEISKQLLIPTNEIYNFIYSELKQLNKDLYYELKQIFNTSVYEKQKRK